MDPTKTPEAPPPKQVVNAPEGTIRSREQNPKMTGIQPHFDRNERNGVTTYPAEFQNQHTGENMKFTAQSRATSALTQYHTGVNEVKDPKTGVMTKETYVIMSNKNFSGADALLYGTPMKVPPGVHPDDVIHRAEIGLKNGMTKEQVAKFAPDPDQLKHPLKTESEIKNAVKQTLHPPKGGVKNVVVAAATTAAGMLVAGAASAADGGNADEIGRAVVNEANSGVAGQAVDAFRAATQGNLAPAGQLAKVTVGAAMGAKMGAAAGAAIFGAPTLGAGAVPGAVAGGVVGGIIGGTVAAMDPKEFKAAAEENQRNNDDRAAVIKEVRKMSDKDIAAIKNPGDRELMKGIKQAVTTADEAEARANEVTQGPAAGNVGKRQQAMTTARAMASNRDDLIDTTLQNDNDGAGDRVRKFVAERQQPQQAPQAPAPAQEPQEQAPLPMAQRNQQMSTTPGMG